MNETSILGVSSKWLRENKILVSILTNWDKEFISSIYEWCRYKGSRTLKQQKVFERIQWKSRLEKIPDKLPEEKFDKHEERLNKINFPIPYKKSIKVMEKLAKWCGKAWFLLTKPQKTFLEETTPKIKNGGSLSRTQMKIILEIKDVINNRLKLLSYLNRIVRKWKTKEITGSENDTVNIISIHKMTPKAIWCDVIVNKNKSGMRIIQNVWIPRYQVF